MSDRHPLVTKASWTFHLEGLCTVCGTKVHRTKTFDAENQEAAQAQADYALKSLRHPKCGD